MNTLEVLASVFGFIVLVIISWMSKRLAETSKTQDINKVNETLASLSSTMNMQHSRAMEENAKQDEAIAALQQGQQNIKTYVDDRIGGVYDLIDYHHSEDKSGSLRNRSVSVAPHGLA